MGGFEHIPVMPEQCLEALRVKPGGVYVDCTAGGAKPLCIWKE